MTSLPSSGIAHSFPRSPPPPFSLRTSTSPHPSFIPFSISRPLQPSTMERLKEWWNPSDPSPPAYAPLGDDEDGDEGADGLSPPKTHQRVSVFEYFVFLSLGVAMYSPFHQRTMSSGRSSRAYELQAVELEHVHGMRYVFPKPFCRGFRHPFAPSLKAIGITN